MESLEIIQITPTRLQELIFEAVKLALSENKSSTSSENVQDIFTVDETAAYFKVERQTIYNWCHKGIIEPSIKGGRVYFKRSELRLQEDTSHILFRAHCINYEIRKSINLEIKKTRIGRNK